MHLKPLMAAGAVTVVLATAALVLQGFRDRTELRQATLSELWARQQGARAPAAAWTQAGKQLVFLERWGEARSQLEEAVRRDPTDAEARFLYARVLQKTGQPMEAIAQLREVVRLAPRWGAPHFMLGHGLIWRDQASEAVQILEEYTTLEPGDAMGFYWLGIALMRLEQYEASERALRRAVELAPRQPYSHLGLGTLLLTRGEGPADIDGAIAELSEAARLDPTSTETLKALGRARSRAGHLREAEQTYLKALALDPQEEAIAYNLSQVYARLKDPRRAADYARRAAEIRRLRQATTDLGRAPGDDTPTRPGG